MSLINSYIDTSYVSLGLGALVFAVIFYLCNEYIDKFITFDVNSDVFVVKYRKNIYSFCISIICSIMFLIMYKKILIERGRSDVHRDQFN